MEARHDLHKFITELAVAERGVVLSSGRELFGSAGGGPLIVEERVTARVRAVSGRPSRSVCRINRRIDNVVRLTPETGIESSTRTGSDQTAAEALQEAETEVGVAAFGGSGWEVQGHGGPWRRSTEAAIDVGLTA